MHVSRQTNYLLLTVRLQFTKKKHALNVFPTFGILPRANQTFSSEVLALVMQVMTGHPIKQSFFVLESLIIQVCTTQFHLAIHAPSAYGGKARHPKATAMDRVRRGPD